MNAADMIRQACKTTGTTLTELAKRTGQALPALSRKLKRNCISFEEFETYMRLLGVQVNISIKYKNGETAAYKPTDELTLGKIKVLEAQLEAEKQNSKLNEILDKDIRTQLQSIEGFVKMAMNKAKNLETAKDYFAQIEKSLDSIYSTMDSTEPEPVDYEDVSIDMDFLKGRKILLVDDNEVNRALMRDILTDSGFEVTEAVDGEEAYKLISDVKLELFDYVLMDIEMPVLNGYAATEKIRGIANRRRANVPIIAMTASASREDKQKAIKSGMDAYLTKPVSVKKLYSTFMHLA